MAAEVAHELERAREAYARMAWREARDAFERADREAPTGAEDLERLATSAFMLGRIDDFLSVLERAHHAYVEAGNGCRAARCAFFIGVNLRFRGETARATGWWARGQRLVEREGGNCAERGYLMLSATIRGVTTGDYETAYAAAARAAEIGERFRDPDLYALALQAQGNVLLHQGRVEDGLGLLDEAMLGVAGGELSPIVTGVVYCNVIAGCEEVYDVGRAREWTQALSEWCEAQPDMMSFSGRCLAHRAEIMRIHGAWPDALEEARRARERCERAMNRAAAGQAIYQLGEVHRLRGEVEAAEAAYLEANAYGREPQPGLALLRLLQGDVEAAAGAARRALGECTDPLGRARLLPAYADIMLACGSVGEARSASEELDGIVAACPSAMLGAIGSRVRGAVELAEGDPHAALVSLRAALAGAQGIGAPYEAARARVLLGLGCRALGDEDTAALELEAAREAFAALGAAPDLAGLPTGVPAAQAAERHALTARELEVLRLVAVGKSNRQIAADLVVSEHTVARHLQNIRGKLGVPSRTAAAAFAFEHDLV
jgi:DNA-binding NarL/FixJ family response regulator